MNETKLLKILKITGVTILIGSGIGTIVTWVDNVRLERENKKLKANLTTSVQVINMAEILLENNLRVMDKLDNENDELKAQISELQSKRK